MASSGSKDGFAGCALAPSELTSPNAIPPTRPATADSRNGSKEEILQSILEALAQDIERRGKIDLGECYIDATFVSTKKGGLVLAGPSGVKAARSWQYQLLQVLASPSTLKLLAQMKSSW